MTWYPAEIATADKPDCQPVRQAAHDVGGMTVQRALPTRYCRSIGPFVFLDQMGPSHFPAGEGVNVQQHPHIGLGTITYLLEGEILHRDSLGTDQVITPGAVNWMNAGRGIVHSETTPDEVQTSGQTVYGLQAWLALPQAFEQMSPEFQHTAADSLPIIESDGCTIRLLIGQWLQQQSPVKLPMNALYADIQLSAGVSFNLPGNVAELGLYLLSGSLSIADAHFSGNQLLDLEADSQCTVSALESARLMLIGGDALDGHRHMWWNFVSSDRQRIEQAKQDWANGRFTLADTNAPVIPLPDYK